VRREDEAAHHQIDGFDELAIDGQGQYQPSCWTDECACPEHILPLL
jgi:hypothetical protein